jgi:ribosomal protein S18 acetylase RimI-like enzyme
MKGTEVRALRTHEQRAAAAVTSRALVDSPTSVAIYGDDPVVTVAGLYRELGSFFELLPDPQLAAFAGECVIAAAGMAPPGGCIGAFLSSGASELVEASVPPVGDPTRAHAFWAHWAEADLAEEHWHLGPVGVEPGYQGRGIGGALMGAVCAWLDEGGRRAWLETDKARNVRFYSALGFEVAMETVVIGVDTWYMRRDPHS